MNVILQELAKKYYEKRTEKNFNDYYNGYKGIAHAAAASILRDGSQAFEVVNDLFTKFYNREDENFQFDVSKSHVGYVWHSSSNLAKIRWNKNRVKVNNLQNVDSRAEHPELDYMEEILLNEAENIKVGLGFARKDYMNYDSVYNFYLAKLSEYGEIIETDICKTSDLEEINTFLSDFGCTTSIQHRIHRMLKIKKGEPITNGDLITYTNQSIHKLERLIEIKEAKSLEDIKKIKSKHTRKKIGKVMFENTKVDMLILESNFHNEDETGDTLEYLGYINSGNYEMDVDSGMGHELDVIFGAGNLQYSKTAQLEFVRKLIDNNEDNENPGLLKRVLVSNHEFKSVLDNIVHIIKMGEKDGLGNTKEDLVFCMELASTITSIPTITKEIKEIKIKSCNSTEEIREALEKLRTIIVTNTQLKCSQTEFGFDSVGAIKSRSHRQRKFIKEEFDRKMVISEIIENRLHRVTGEVVDKYEDTGIIRLKCIFKNGILHGAFRTFHKNGNKKIIKLYCNGKLDGDYREFYDNGKLKIHGEYSNNIKVGAWYVYREDGSKDELAIIGNDGSKLYELYDKQGNVQGSGMIRNGK